MGSIILIDIGNSFARVQIVSEQAAKQAAPWYNILISPSENSIAKAADFYFGFLGFILTVVTLVVATKAKRAAEDARIKVDKYDIFAEAAKLTIVLTSVIRDPPPAQWSTILDCLADSRDFLVDAEIAVAKHDEKLAARLRGSAALNKRMISQIDGAQAGKGSHPDHDDLLKALRKVSDNIKDTQRVLRDQLL